jgi:septal ring factor EnvC (AmiA/AmiB activator)
MDQQLEALMKAARKRENELALAERRLKQAEASYRAAIDAIARYKNRRPTPEGTGPLRGSETSES